MDTHDTKAASYDAGYEDGWDGVSRPSYADDPDYRQGNHDGREAREAAEASPLWTAPTRRTP